ncbi:MAG: hypothetical protein K9L20_14745, partial [Desulfarculaceae bacterium]|nr:hypothetical protein [Desulfarculaceae bacterium]
MRAFKVGEDTYTYDACIEFLCEKALEALLENGGGGGAEANYFSATVEVFPPEYSLSTDVPTDEQTSVTALNNARNNTRKSLHNWLISPNKHEIFLEDHNADFVVNLNNFYDDNKRYNYLKKCVAPLWVRSIWHIPLAFHLCLRLGLIADLNWWCLDGAHSGFKTEIIEVWRNAIDDLHPFQHGPTHQGTKHCIQVHNNFCALKHFFDVRKLSPYETNDKDGIGDITADEWGLMSVAAALHDIGKADIIVPLGDHAINGA